MRLATIKVFDTPGFLVDKVSVSIQGNLLKKGAMMTLLPQCEVNKVNQNVWWIKQLKLGIISLCWMRGLCKMVKLSEATMKRQTQSPMSFTLPPKLYAQVMKKDPSSKLAIYADTNIWHEATDK
jgi:hypothetical protein